MFTLREMLVLVVKGVAASLAVQAILLAQSAERVTQDSRSDTNRQEKLTINAVSITYSTGRDADERTPVFDLSLGEIRLENISSRSINLKYDATQMLYSGHHFAFGPSAAKTFTNEQLRPHDYESDFVDYNLAPGQTVLLSRRDLMAVILREGVETLQNGEVCTRFEGTIQIDNVTHPLLFGPHCFQVALDRDWEKEKKRYIQFFLARDNKP